MLNLLLPFFGRVKPPAPPVVGAISLAPASPGDLGLAPGTWTTRVTATGGLTQVKWMVGVPGAKTITFDRTLNNTAVANYNHGDVIDFINYGTGFTLSKVTSGANTFLASGSAGNTTFTIGAETQVSDVRFTVAGAGGTGPIAYTILDLVSGQADIQATFFRPGDSLIVKNVLETVGVNTPAVVFGGAGTKSITLTPHAPGDLGVAPAAWTTRVNTVGLNQVQWIVLDANFVGSGTTEFTVVDMVNGTGQITCNFLKAGDRLVVKDNTYTIQDVSDQVTFGGSARTLSMTPLNPGNLGTAPATWETVVTAGNMASFEWVIRNSDNSLVGNWAVANVVNNTATLRVTFTATGQRLVISTPDNTVRQESGLVSFGTIIVPSTGDYAFANDFVKDLTVGINLERGSGYGEPLAFYQKLKSDSHATHLRWFPPSRPDWSILGENDINNFANMVQLGIQAGFKVLFSCTDVISLEYANSQQVKDYVEMCCRVFAARNIDPRKLAFGTWNELGHWTTDNTESNPIRRYYKDRLRSWFPNHNIIVGSADWSAYEALTDPTMETFDDKRVLYEWHSYPFDASDLGRMQAIQQRLDDFKNSRGVVTINGELAQAGETGGTEPPNIPPVIYSSSRGSWRERPTFWTITGGQAFRMNEQGNSNLLDYQAAALRDADAYIRAQPGFGS